VVGMQGYPDGLYRVDALTRNELFPPKMQRQGAPLRTGAPADLMGDAQAVLAGQAALDGAANERLGREFEAVAAPGGSRLYLRRP
jgi:hypothetical protein